MKKYIFFCGCIALLACFAACDKPEDGVYSPSKKIHKIYEVNENGDTELSQVWNWDGDMLTSIDNYYGLADIALTDYFTYDENSRLTRIENGSSHSEFYYNGKNLGTVLVYQGGEQVARYEFEYKGRKISVIKMEIDGDLLDLFKGKEWSANPLHLLLPDLSQTLQPVVKQYVHDAKGAATLTMTLHWDGHNVKTMDIDMDGFFGFSTTATAECTFDNKRNPFKGFFSLLSSSTNLMETAFHNHNNLLTVTTRIASMLSTKQENSYEYDGNYPVKMVSKTSYGTSFGENDEAETTTKIYEYGE